MLEKGKSAWSVEKGMLKGCWGLAWCPRNDCAGYSVLVLTLAQHANPFRDTIQWKPKGYGNQYISVLLLSSTSQRRGLMRLWEIEGDRTGLSYYVDQNALQQLV